MCNLDYDAPDLYKKIVRKSLKSYFCYECSRVIEKNEKYSYVFAVYGKDKSVFRTCLHCLIGQEWLLNQCGGYMHGNLQEEIREHAEDYKRMDLYRFIISMGNQWKSKKIPTLNE